MSEYRKDPLTGRWVIIAEERFSRPNQFFGDEELPCPFCPGNENHTPNELDAFRKNDSENSDWTVRVVPNKFSAVAEDERFPDHRVFRANFGGMLDVDAPLANMNDPKVAPLPGVGSHEVIVDSSRHVLSFTELDDDENFDMFRMYRQRLRTLKNENHWAHALIFKNVGEAAGASIEHTHTQLLAMPFIPPPIQREFQRLIQFRSRTELCYWCAHIDFELKNKVRIVEETDRFLALCPYLSRFPFEVSIFPKKHISHFESLKDDELSELAKLTADIVRILERGTSWMPGKLAYNMILKSGPFFYPGPPDAVHVSDSSPWFRTIDYAFENAYHFHITLMPSLAKAAGFEWGCGLHINPISPETAAAKLREIKNS